MSPGLRRDAMSGTRMRRGPPNVPGEHRAGHGCTEGSRRPELLQAEHRQDPGSGDCHGGGRPLSAVSQYGDTGTHRERSAAPGGGGGRRGAQPGRPGATRAPPAVRGRPGAGARHGGAARRLASPERLPGLSRGPGRLLPALAARGADGRPGREYRGGGAAEGGGHHPLWCFSSPRNSPGSLWLPLRPHLRRLILVNSRPLECSPLSPPSFYKVRRKSRILVLTPLAGCSSAQCREVPSARHGLIRAGIPAGHSQWVGVCVKPSDSR